MSQSRVAAPPPKADKPTTVTRKTRTSKGTRTATGTLPYRVRVRMYRHGLGDCFLVSLPRHGQDALQVLIDFGALARNSDFMTEVAREIRDTLSTEQHAPRARLDIVVATHEHRDHISGFNQARAIFDEMEIQSVWMSWAENLTQTDVTRIKETRKHVLAQLHTAVESPLATLSPDGLAGVAHMLAFTDGDASSPAGTVADALEYLKTRGRSAGDLRYLEPGDGPIPLPGVADVRVYVLGPPHDPSHLKTSAVTERMKREGLVYHLTSADCAMDALCAGLLDAADPDANRYHPFGREHRIPRPRPDLASGAPSPSAALQPFLTATYDDPRQDWRRIDGDWLGGFEQLALALDNDTNNTSLVLAFEIVSTGDVLLFVGDAQIGSWQSWPGVHFASPGTSRRTTGADLLANTVFYKVGHHGSHNATMRDGGLERMHKQELVAFMPLDQATARKQGTKGWDVPASPLLTALQAKTNMRVVISDTTEHLPAQAVAAGVTATATHIDYIYR